jgi:N-acetylglutamate synthase-like GNAT family acetyltransferase
MQPLIIQLASEADTAIIRQIAEGTWPQTYGHIISAEQISYMMDMMYSDTSLQEQMQKGHRFYLALFHAAAIGFASISDEEEKGYKLNKLYVLPQIQKTGAGKALLQQCIDHAKTQGASRLFLQVNKQNNAKDFYIRMGFSIHEEVKLDIGNGFYMNDYIMHLPL